MRSFVLLPVNLINIRKLQGDGWVEDLAAVPVLKVEVEMGPVALGLGQVDLSNHIQITLNPFIYINP